MLCAYADRIRGRVVLDAGSGSDAILGAVAHRLGAKKIFCVEWKSIDAEKSKRFLRLNSIKKEEVEVINADFSLIGDIGEIDVVIANLSKNGFHSRDMGSSDANHLDGSDNWHRFLAEKFKPEIYFLCGMIGKTITLNTDDRINRARQMMEEAGYAVILEKDFYYNGEHEISTAFVLQAKSDLDKRGAGYLRDQMVGL